MKKRKIFIGVAVQMAFATAPRQELVQWQKQIIEYGKAELLK